jgi:hypothetical protein
MLIKFLFRVVLVGMALVYALPQIEGVKFFTELIPTIITSVVFNLLFLALEWLLDVIVIGINISTLSIGVIFARLLEFVALVLAPAVALYGCAKFLPGYLQVNSFYPSSIVAGLVLGGVLFAHSLADKRK